ncbi:MAG: chemotaxis protein CheX [Archangium sp.]|nr:chemotaxis protein CheX [Archangium sp.]MDP3572175.1 chemotaxis protein CheX [Archangium sp.]
MILPEVEALIRPLASAACIELFESYGISMSQSTQRSVKPSGYLLCGAMGFVGPQLKGSILFAGTQEPLRQVAGPNPLRDWVAELTNQMVGRLKTKLLRVGVEIYLTTPVVLRGEHIVPLPDNCPEPLFFADEQGSTLCVWLDLEPAPGLEFAHTPNADALGEGEELMF